MPGSTSVLCRSSGTGLPIEAVGSPPWALGTLLWVFLLEQGLGQMDPEGLANLSYSEIVLQQEMFPVFLAASPENFTDFFSFPACQMLASAVC